MSGKRLVGFEEFAKPIGLKALNPPCEMVNFIELHLTAQVKIRI